jgi:nucleotide-binding universal stress UspA family protein
MKVLVATDGSVHAMKAVHRGLEMAERGAAVTLMAVAIYATDFFEDMPPAIKEKLEEDAKTALAKGKAVFDEKNLNVETIMEAGLNPANNIIRRATEGKFDRIVLGSAGKSGLALVLLGSTATKVVAHAPCEVTVVR